MSSDEDNHPTYSHSATIEAITSFYEFLVGLHLPASVLKRPPPTGWPHLTSTSLSFLDKTPTVIELMRHIPYIEAPPYSDPDQYQIYEKTICNDFMGEGFWTGGPDQDWVRKENTEPGEGYSTIPAHVLVLARSETRDGYWIFIDTNRGTAVLADFQDGFEPDRERRVSFEGYSMEPAKGDDDPEQWMTFNTYAIPDFFEMLKEDFRQFHVIPSRPTEVHMSKRCSKDDISKLKDVYVEHRWPGEHYKKEECLKKAEDLWHEQLFGGD